MVRNRKILTLFGFILFPMGIKAKELTEATKNTLRSFLNNYQRPITVLELCCYKKTWSLSLASTYKGVFVIAPEKRAHKLVKKAEKQQAANVVILDPLHLNPRDMDYWARCEYFDVVFVHDIHKSTLRLWMPALSELGDYILIVIKPEDLHPYRPLFESVRYLTQVENMSLFLLKTRKKGLDVARWNLCGEHPHQPLSMPRYPVFSSFNKKELHKNGKITTWIPGINLMTFIMLRGIYPSNDYIKNELIKLKNIDHNDLVLGNLVVMGAHKIVPIDFKDPRHKIDPKKCLAAAIAYFSKEKDRFKNPRESLNYYNQCLKGK